MPVLCFFSPLSSSPTNRFTLWMFPLGAEVFLLSRELQREFLLTWAFISHSLPVVAQPAACIAVMRAGPSSKIGSEKEILRQPKNPTAVNSSPPSASFSVRAAFLLGFAELRCR